MPESGDKKFRLSLSASILWGLALGVLCGLFFGEYCAFLQVFGDAFIKLLQMSILPFIIVSLITGIGGLSYGKAKALGIKAGLVLLLLWGIGFAAIFLMAQAFPTVESASFFSTSIIEPKKTIDFLELFIPSNPFRSLANNVIPASVLFSITLGIAFIGMKNKEGLLHDLSLLSKALTRVAHFVVYLTPIGVFAIAASAAGTMSVDEFGRLQVFFITYIVTAVFLAFWVLPMLLLTLTPFKYKDVLGLSKDTLITGFSTGNLFIILPVLIRDCKALFSRYTLDREDTGTYVDVIIPVSFNFPGIAKLLALSFVLFAAWFYGNPLSVTDYPEFAVTGLVSSFAGMKVALPFLLDTLEIPADAFQLYIVTGIVNKRFGVLLGAMGLLVLTVLTTCAIGGILSIKWKRFVGLFVTTLILTAGIVAGTRAVLELSVKSTYTKDKAFTDMHMMDDPLPVTVHSRPLPEPPPHDPRKSRLTEIRERGFIRVGYREDLLPHAFTNAKGQLVGFDVEMAHRLAKDLSVSLEFVPLDDDKMAEQLNAGYFDVIMSGIAVTTDGLEKMTYSASIMEGTLAFIVEDHRRDEFNTSEAVQNLEAPRIGIPDAPYYVSKLRHYLPQANIVLINSPKAFFEDYGEELDAYVYTAEAGSAWTLLYPGYSVVVPYPDILAVPMAYPVALGDRELVDFLNGWIELKRKDRTIENLYNHWILGQGADKEEPRWSVIRNVLHWVD